MDQRKFYITYLSFLWITLIRGDVCSNQECVHASALILQRIDTKVDPCDNFYDFSCGTFIEENYTPDESVAVDSFTKLRDTIDSQVYALLSDADDEVNATSPYKLSKELFKTCLERARTSGDEDVKALKEIIEALGGWPILQGAAWDGSEWTMGNTVGKLRKILGHRTDKIFDIASFIIKLENANNPSIRSSVTFFTLRNAYSNYIKSLASFLGASNGPSERDEELNHLLDFEFKMNTINLKYQELSQTGAIKAQPGDLLKNIFYIQWIDFLHPSEMKNIEMTSQIEAEASDIKGESFVEEMGKLLNATSTRTLANFVILRLVDFVVAQSTSDFRELYVKFQMQIDGRQDHEQKWKGCVDVLSKNLPFAIGAVYIDKYFKADTKASVVEMFNNIKMEFITLIEQAAWVDEGTRDKLLGKLKSLVPLIAHPDDGFDEHSINEFYDGIKLDKSQYLRTLFQLRVVDADNKFRQTYTSTALESSNGWKKYLPPTSIAALYSQSDNTIRFSAGILQNIVFKAHTINYLEYGATGFIIAHEISHIVNQILDDVQSLPEKTLDAYAEKKLCLIEQYSQYREPDTTENLDGKRTLIENIADNTGITLAYRAYRKWNEKFTNERRSLIGLDYTWDQLFWLSAAQTWCGIYRPEEITRKITSDSYATERFRVIGPLSNSPDFAKDFSCSQSSSMNRKNKCIIW